MAIRTTSLGGTDWADDTVLYGADLNDTFDVCAPAAKIPDQGSSTYVYTGSAFDCSISTSGGTDSNSHTIQISAAELKSAAFVMVHITFRANAQWTSAAAYSSIKVERNETGQASWSDVIASNQVTDNLENTATNSKYCSTISGFIATTAGERTNGIDIKITGTSSSTAGGAATLNNMQTWITMAN